MFGDLHRSACDNVRMKNDILTLITRGLEI